MKCKKSTVTTPQQSHMQTALQIPEIISCIAGNCRPEDKNNLMRTCTHFDAYLKNRELILRANPSTIHMKDKIKAIFQYASSGNLSMVEFLFTIAKISLTIENSLGMTPLHYAMEKNHPHVVQFLIEHGANVHYPKPYLYPLHDAAYKGDEKYVKSLLELEVDLNYALENGNTPLKIAILEGHTKIKQLLITTGAKETIESSFDQSMLGPINVKKFRALIEQTKNNRYW